MCLSHIGDFCNTANFFIIIITSVITTSDVTAPTHWRCRWWLAFFFLAKNYILINVCPFFRHNATIHKRLPYCVNMTFVCTVKLKKSCQLLYGDFFYCGGLELNQQYLWGMAVLYVGTFSRLKKQTYKPCPSDVITYVQVAESGHR